MDQETPTQNTQTPNSVPENNAPVTPPVAGPETTPTSPTEQPVAVSGKGYSKKPIWFWVLIYVGVGAVVYFAAYYFLFANKY